MPAPAQNTNYTMGLSPQLAINIFPIQKHKRLLFIKCFFFLNRRIFCVCQRSLKFIPCLYLFKMRCGHINDPFPHSFITSAVRHTAAAWSGKNSVPFMYHISYIISFVAGNTLYIMLDFYAEFMHSH